MANCGHFLEYCSEFFIMFFVYFVSICLLGVFADQKNKLINKIHIAYFLRCILKDIAKQTQKRKEIMDKQNETDGVILKAKHVGIVSRDRKYTKP